MFISKNKSSYISNHTVKKLESYLGKHIEIILGLRRSSRRFPFLKAFNIDNVMKSIRKASIDFVKDCLYA